MNETGSCICPDYSNRPIAHRCSVCVLDPWNESIRKRVQRVCYKYIQKHPRANPTFVQAMGEEIQEALGKKIYQFYLNCADGERETWVWGEEEHHIERLMQKEAEEAYARHQERRQMLVTKFIVGAVEAVIIQHFPRPIEKELLLLPFPKKCRVCSRLFRAQFNYDFDFSSDEEDEERYFSDNWGVRPTKQLRDFLTEECLAVIDGPQVPDSKKAQRAYEKSRHAIHRWQADRSLA